MNAISFREAEPSDASMLGALHVTSWRETYAGLLPDQLLDEQSKEARAAMWRRVLEDPAQYSGTFVLVAEREGEMVGFGACCIQRHEALSERGYDGEFGAVYVLRAHQGEGVGTMLMRLLAGKLLDKGLRGGALWVLSENLSARKFYEKLGGVCVDEKADEHSGAVLTEVAYGWVDLSRLLA